MQIDEDKIIYIDQAFTQPYGGYKSRLELESLCSQFTTSKLQLKPHVNRETLSIIEKSIQSNYQQNPSSSRRIRQSSQCKGTAHLKRLSVPRFTKPSSSIDLIATGKALKSSRNNSSQPKRPVRSAMSCRSEPYQQSEHFLRPMGSVSSIRSKTAYQKISVKKDPLVIYPFQSKLKMKRVDDNPKVLEQIITHKHKNTSKQQLYDFVRRIIMRRSG